MKEEQKTKEPTNQRPKTDNESMPKSVLKKKIIIIAVVVIAVIVAIILI